MKEKIDAKKLYTAKSVVDMGILPFKSRCLFYDKLKKDEFKKIFKPIYIKKNVLTMVFIKGQNIINYKNLK